MLLAVQLYSFRIRNIHTCINASIPVSVSIKIPICSSISNEKRRTSTKISIMADNNVNMGFKINKYQQ